MPLPVFPRFGLHAHTLNKGLMLAPERLLRHQRSRSDSSLHNEKKVEPEDLLAQVEEEDSPLSLTSE